MTDLESYLIRRAVCELTSKNYNRLFANLIRSLREEKTFSSGAIRQWLLAQKAETSLWPNDDTFKEAWMKLRFYKRLSKATTRLILEAINSEMHTPKTENINTKHTLTIEHLLPAEWKKHWPLPVDDNDTIRWNQAADQRNDLLHRIGNLTLLTKSLNPSISNGPWLKKKEQILKHSALNLNRAFQDDIEWNEEKIEKRSIELFDYAVKIWPYPPEAMKSPN